MWKCKSKFCKFVYFKWIAESENSDFEMEIIDNLTELPHFKTELTDKNVPEQTTLLIQGIKGKIDKNNKILDKTMETKLKNGY